MTFFHSLKEALHAIHIGWTLALILSQVQSALGDDQAAWKRIFRSDQTIFASSESDDAPAPPVALPDPPPAPPAEAPPAEKTLPPPIPPRELSPPVVQRAPLVLTRPPQHDRPTLASVIQRAVRLDEEMPSILASASQPKKMVGYAPDWCIPCWEKKPTATTPGVPRLTSPISYLKHNAFEIEWRPEEFPQARFYPCVRDRESGFLFYRNHMDSPEAFLGHVNKWRKSKGYTTMAAVNTTATAGVIDRDFIMGFLDQLDESGVLTIPNKEASVPHGWLTLTIPAKVSANLTTSGSTRKFTFDPNRPPSVTVGPKTWTVASVTITSKTLTLNIDWFPDISLELN